MRRVCRNQLRGLQPLMPDAIKIGSRGSKLALWQANWVKSELESTNPSLAVEISIIKTKGDKILDAPLAKVGGKGLFVGEIEEELVRGDIDIAVHSMKDIPALRPTGVTTVAILERDSPADFLAHTLPLDTVTIIGTSSTRRRAQILRNLPPHIIGMSALTDRQPAE